MSRITLLLVLVAGCVAGCQSRAASTPFASTLEQWQGMEGGGETAGTRVLRSTAEWQAFWQQVEKPAPRPLDPAREMAVAILLGQRRTAGYRAEVIRSQPAGDSWVIEYREHAPEPGTLTAQMITDPWVVVILSRTDRPLVIKRLNDPSPPAKK